MSFIIAISIMTDFARFFTTKKQLKLPISVIKHINIS
mgnify:CR=1 FL=1